LDYLHNQKPDTIIFRDMKPSNVMIDSLGKVRLIDFGIARTFTSGTKGTMIGTEGYSAPEQYKGEATPQSDIYSLGATIHHILTRKDPRLDAPFTFHERPIPNFNQKAPPDFVRVIDKALSFNAAERYTSCAEMKVDLERVKMRMAGMVMSSSGITLADNAPASSTSTPPRATVGTNNAAAPAPIERTSFFEGGENAAIQPRWVFKTEDEIRASPASTKDLALVGSYDRNVWALKLDSGDLAWKFPTKGGIASSPAIDETARLVMFGSEDFTFYAVDYRTGRISWTYGTKDRVRSSPRVAHDHVFFGSDDGKLYALGISTGRFLWGYDTGTPVRSRPFVTNDLVIVGAESGEVVAVTLSGNRKWSYRTKKGVIAAPTVDDDGNCYVASTDGWVYALDTGTGFNSWRFRTNGPIFSAPIEQNGLLYFGSTDSNFYCLNSQTSREKWKFAASKPIIGSGVYYKGAIYFGCTDEHLYCLEADSGKERWRFKTSAPITSAPSIAGDLLLVSSMDHKLYALPLVG
jgi:outer membrane protein assembly factor BamB